MGSAFMPAPWPADLQPLHAFLAEQYAALKLPDWQPSAPTERS